MDEVLKALDDKEKQISGSDLTPTDGGHTFEDELPPRSAPRQEVNPRLSAAAPPLPSQPPRVVSFLRHTLFV